MADLNYNCINRLWSLVKYYYVMAESEGTTLTGSLFGHLIFEEKINNKKN